MPFFIAAGLALLSLILAIIFLPESHPVEKQPKEKEAIIDLRAWWEAILSPIGTLFTLTFLSTCGLMIFANVFGLYALEKFGFGPEDVGVMMMVLGLVSALAQGLLAGPITKKWGDGVVIKVGFLGTALSYGLMLLANSYATILLTTAFFALIVALQVPALTALTSRRATVQQGIAMGLSNSFVSLGRIVGPILGGVVLDINLNLPYLSGAGFMLIGFLVSLLWVNPEIPQQEMANI
jgi:DHA1 family multidrug resistance protein-like MFS transporter